MRIDYNQHRPHTSLRGLTPNEFATRSRSDPRGTESSYGQGLIGSNVSASKDVVDQRRQTGGPEASTT